MYRNDCRYLAARWRGSTHHLCSGSDSEDGPRTRRLVSLSLAAVAVLHASGDAAVTGMLARAKADVFPSLDDANGFRDLGEDGASREALNAVRRARHAMGRVCGAVSRLLPRRLGARLARELLAAYAEKVAENAFALSDVSVDESDSLRGIFVEAFDPRGLLVALPGTLAGGGGRVAADAEACALVDGLEGDAWMKGSFFPSMLDARLTDLAQWWDEGRLTRARLRRRRGGGVRTRQLRGEREPCRGAGTIGRAVTIGRDSTKAYHRYGVFLPKNIKRHQGPPRSHV